MKATGNVKGLAAGFHYAFAEKGVGGAKGNAFYGFAAKRGDVAGNVSLSSYAKEEKVYILYGKNGLGVAFAIRFKQG